MSDNLLRTTEGDYWTKIKLKRICSLLRDSIDNQSLPSLASRVLYDLTQPQVQGWVTPAIVRTGTELTYRAVITDASAIDRVQV